MRSNPVATILAFPHKSSHKTTPKLSKMFLMGVHALVCLLAICASVERSGRILEDVEAIKDGSQEGAEASQQGHSDKSTFKCADHGLDLVLDRKRKGPSEATCEQILYCKDHRIDQDICSRRYGAVYYKCPRSECQTSRPVGRCQQPHDPQPCTHPPETPIGDIIAWKRLPEVEEVPKDQDIEEQQNPQSDYQ